MSFECKEGVSVTTSDQYRVILHVTDLHLSNIGLGSTDFLRAGYYKEYLRNMWRAIGPQVRRRVDLIVATGDFVDRGETHNFEHAANVLRELANVVGLDESRVAVCIGNHDIVREKDTKSHHDEARAAFHEFSNRFSSGKVVNSSKRATLLAYDGDIFCLMLDGTLGSPETDAPGTLDLAVTDQLISEFIRPVPEDKVLVIGSHYPISPFPDDFAQRMEGPEYLKRHFWSDAILLKKRVKDLRVSAPTLWLFGDVHHSDAYSEGQHFHIVTGRLGVRIPEPPRKDSLQPRQCRVVTLPLQGDGECRVITGNFILDSHTPQQELGNWIASSAPFRRTGAVWPDAEKREIEASSQTSSRESAQTPQPPNVHTVTVLDQNLNSLIYEKVRNDGLYRMGRFRTSGDRDSLGWVSVGQILASGEYFARFCSASLLWLKTTFEFKPHINGMSVLFIGIDCWGASIATILGAACGSEAMCVAVRADGRYHTVGELVDDDVIACLKRSETVVVVTDVIATGHSITSLYDRIRQVCPDAIRPQQRWLALTVLIDANQTSLPTCPFLAGVGVGCVDIKLPGVPCAILPGDDIAPPMVSFL